MGCKLRPISTFRYTPPTDHLSLCTTNLPDPVIADGSTAFDVITATGTGAERTFTMPGGFGPGLVWAKQRNGATNNALFDVVRGATKRLVSNAAQAEDTQANQLSAFTSDGFTYGSDLPNASGNAGVYWAWDAGESNTSISPGSLNSSAYNQSAVWSSMCSPTPSINTFASGFDGSTATTFRGGISAGSYFTFTPTGGITFTDKVRVYNGNVSGASYKYNNGSATSFPINSWTTVATGGGTMTSFAVTRNTTAVHGWFAIEVDGRILVDQGATPAVSFPTIASIVRANPSTGFSIVSYTGNYTANTTIGHSLNAAPELIICKSRTSSDWWPVYHKSLGNTQAIYLNETNAAANSAMWSNTSPTSQVFTVGANDNTNKNNADIIAYCFTPVEGYSAFGSYTGNGSTDGPFVFCGFRPRWILVKNTSINGSNWRIVDTARNTYNEANLLLNPNSSNDEQTTTANEFDILSNGFKLRGTDNDTNGSAETLIYAAFAEHPFKTSRAR